MYIQVVFWKRWWLPLNASMSICSISPFWLPSLETPIMQVLDLLSLICHFLFIVLYLCFLISIPFCWPSSFLSSAPFLCFLKWPFCLALLPISCDLLLSGILPVSSHLIIPWVLSFLPDSDCPTFEKFTAKYFISSAPWQNFSGDIYPLILAKFWFIFSFFSSWHFWINALIVLLWLLVTKCVEFS